MQKKKSTQTRKTNTYKPINTKNNAIKINTRKEIPQAFSNATYLGDYTRAGVGVIFLPGVMVGTNCVIGAGTILNKQVKSNTLIYAKQELVEKEWSHKKYGW